MKASSLRLGNYVQVLGKEVVVTLEVFHLIAITSENSYKPIELTEEWLERFGFSGVDAHGGGEIWFIPVEDQVNFVLEKSASGEIKFHHSQPIRFVHSLQNIFHSITQHELNDRG